MSADCLVTAGQVSARLRVRQGLAEDNKVCSVHWGHWDGAPFTPTPCSGAVKGRKGIEGSRLSWQGAQWTGQPAEAQSIDVIDKCSNQGSRWVSTLHQSPRSPLPSQQLSWVPDAAMGSRLLCCVTSSFWEQVRPGHSVGASEMSLHP